MKSEGLYLLNLGCVKLLANQISLHFGTFINRLFSVLEFTLNLGLKVFTSCGNYT